MIATLKGVVSEKLADQVVVEVGGVGYGVYVTAEDYGRLEPDSSIKLYIYDYIREQAHDLFGFSAKDTLSLFELLIGVNGVGPKMAVNILSIGSSEDVRQAIAGGDAAYIQRASGVGKRVAERVVVDLKDKVGLSGLPVRSASLGGISSADEAVQALMSLGYSSSDAAKALSQVDNKLPTEERIKQALQAAS